MYKSGLTELEVVLAVARQQSFRAAAVKLEMSTSAVSNAVAGLESRLGARLFHRTTRSVSLTDAGRQFVDQIKPAIKQIQDAMAAVNDQKATPTGTLHINSSLGAALMAFEPIMMEFLRRYPSMTIDIVTEGRMVDIIAEGFDAGLRASSFVPRDMISVPLSHNIPKAVVGSREYFTLHPKPTVIAHLAKHQCIRARLPNGSPSPWEFVQGSKPVQVEVPGQLILDAPLLMLQAVRNDLGLSQLAEWYIADDLVSGRLERVLESYTAPYPGLCLYYSGHRHIPAGLRALIDLIHEVRDAPQGSLSSVEHT
ncbi:LysR family transcriptional regulator [Pandoraea terrigena]|uniref:HTH-type transcriptional regulator PgrR n=1 Tax=Pandoraea terrigena TaxID=2508292 RepID=A0A5E4WMY7_9BURK|nr:LysR family transcriptional regulator [Pandoraea terrigena]VVE25891.1 HTH-type transcriptional regulator PgrR [Pandoraea terrigena]